jgi:hypothetical protein
VQPELTNVSEAHTAYNFCSDENFSAELIFPPWRWRQWVPSERRYTVRQHSVVYQNLVLLVLLYLRQWLLLKESAQWRQRRGMCPPRIPCYRDCAMTCNRGMKIIICNGVAMEWCDAAVVVTWSEMYIITSYCHGRKKKWFAMCRHEVRRDVSSQECSTSGLVLLSVLYIFH